MAFNEILAARIRDALARKHGIEEKKMFGGIVFMLNGNMLVGVWKDSLIVRLGEEQAEEALLRPHVKPFDITGRPMKNWVLVEPAGVEEEEQVKGWIKRAVKFVKALPAKAIGSLYVQSPMLYQHGELVICTDEKTGMQILQRKYPTQLARRVIPRNANKNTSGTAPGL